MGPKRTYLNILGSDGSLRMTTEESDPKAKRRDWKSPDGEKTGTKWERVYRDISGKVTTIEFYDGDYGKNLIIGLTDGDNDEVCVSIQTNSPFGEDMMKKIPAIDMSKSIKLAPYAFEDDNGKMRKGVTVYQANDEGVFDKDNKVENFFYDKTKKENLYDFPTPKFKKDKKTGENKPFSSDEWKLYFGTCRLFLIDYIEEKHLVKTEHEEKEVEYPESDSDEIPFGDDD